MRNNQKSKTKMSKKIFQKSTIELNTAMVIRFNSL